MLELNTSLEGETIYLRKIYVLYIMVTLEFQMFSKASKKRGYFQQI